MSALDFGARALAVRAAAQAPMTFRQLAEARLPVHVTRIESVGHSQPGHGAATYVADALATPELLSKYPGAVFQGEGGRYFRLLATAEGWITPEMLGCPPYAPGINSQPYVQAAIDYAQALGVKGVLLPQPRYDLWCPPRPPGLSQHTDRAGAPDGHYLVVRKNLSIVGGGRDKTLLRCLNSEGDPNDKISSAHRNMTYKDGVPPYNAAEYNSNYYGTPKRGAVGAETTRYDWMGSGIVIFPDRSSKFPDGDMDYIKLENIEVDGTRTYDPAVQNPDWANWTHKGFRCQGLLCRRIEMRNVTFRNWSGEIYYCGGNTNISHQHLENVTFDGSPQCAFNPGTAASGMFINLQAGNSYQNEIMGGRGQRYVGGRFYDLSSGVSFMSGAAGGANGLDNTKTYAYPLRDPAKVAPYVYFDGLRVERANGVRLGSFLRGKIYTVDAIVVISTGYGTNTDIDLDVESTVDNTAGMDALQLSGPVDLVTPINGAGSLTHYQPMSQVTVRVSCRRTKEAVAAGRSHNSAVRFMSGLIDADTCTFTVDGMAARAVLASGTRPAGFSWPKVTIGESFKPVIPNAFGSGLTAYPNADFSIVPQPGFLAIDPTAVGLFTMTIQNTFPFQVGQKLRIYHINNSTNRIIRLPRSGGGALLTQDRFLTRRGDYIDLVMGLDNLWIEAGYCCQAQLRMTGSASYDAPSIAPGGTTSTTIPVSGAAVGDLVESVSFGGVSTAGLITRAEVTAPNTVTVWLTNPFGADTAVDLPRATIRARVSKWYA